MVLLIQQVFAAHHPTKSREHLLTEGQVDSAVELVDFLITREVAQFLVFIDEDPACLDEGAKQSEDGSNSLVIERVQLV